MSDTPIPLSLLGPIMREVNTWGRATATVGGDGATTRRYERCELLVKAGLLVRSEGTDYGTFTNYTYTLPKG